MIARHHDHELVDHQLARQQRSGSRTGANHPDLGAAVVDPGRDLTARADQQRDRDVRILRSELTDQARQQILPRNRGAADNELAAHPALELVDRLETIEAIRQGLDEINQGKGVSLEEARQASRRFVETNNRTAGLALYREAELLRLQGDLDGRMWLAFRHRTCRRPREDGWAFGGRWDVYVTAFLGDRWLTRRFRRESS